MVEQNGLCHLLSRDTFFEGRGCCLFCLLLNLQRQQDSKGAQNVCLINRFVLV